MSNSRKPSFQTNSTKSFQERSPKRAFNDKERCFDDRRNNEKTNCRGHTARYIELLWKQENKY